MTATVTAYPAGVPVPHVELVVATGYTAPYFTLYRLRTGMEPAVVRGGSQRSLAAGAVLVVDYEAPFGEAVSYQIDYHDADGGVLGVDTTASATLDVAEAWLQDPVNPTAGFQVRRGAGFAATQESTLEASFVAVLGSPALAMLADQRRLGPLNLPMLTLTEAERAAMRSLLGGATSLLLRTPPAWGLVDTALYVAIPGVTEERWADDPTKPSRVWPLTGTPVAPPAAELAVGAVTWADVIDAYSTWADLKLGEPTWLDVQRGV